MDRYEHSAWINDLEIIGPENIRNHPILVIFHCDSSIKQGVKQGDSRFFMVSYRSQYCFLYCVLSVDCDSSSCRVDRMISYNTIANQIPRNKLASRRRDVKSKVEDA
jgi:hypothetical protein